MLKSKNPHDEFVKETLTKKENAVSFLKNYLPNEIKKAVNPEKIKIEKDSFVTEELKQYFSDLLYKIKIKGSEGYIYILFEHKSNPDVYISLQLLEYLLKIWKAKRKQKQKLPVIIPLVIYHGRKNWQVSTKFSDIIELEDNTFQKYIPEFEYILRDLSTYKDEDIIGTDELRARLKILKYIKRREEVHQKFAGLVKQLYEKYGLDFLKPIIIYIYKARDEDWRKFVREIRKISKTGGDVMMTIAEQLKKEGKKEGKIEEQIEIARNLLDVLSIEEISKRTGLSIDKVKNLKKEQSKN